MTSHPGDRDDGIGLMEPWTYTDGDNGELVISTCNPGEVTVQTQGNASLAVVIADDLPEVVAKLYEACGLPSPVILERPGVSIPAGGDPLFCGDLSLRTYEYGIAMGLPGITAAAVAPGTLRRRAAFMAAYADAAEAEPDPADVGALAKAIRSALCPDSERTGLRPGESDETAARAALRWMRDREAGHASA